MQCDALADRGRRTVDHAFHPACPKKVLTAAPGGPVNHHIRRNAREPSHEHRLSITGWITRTGSSGIEGHLRARHAELVRIERNCANFMGDFHLGLPVGPEGADA